MHILNSLCSSLQYEIPLFGMVTHIYHYMTPLLFPFVSFLDVSSSSSPSILINLEIEDGEDRGGTVPL